jgi:hypothetical protein
VTQVPEDTARSKDHEYAPLKKDREKNQPDINHAVQKLVPFTVAVHQRQTAPESREAKQVAPKRVIVLSSVVDGVRYDQEQDAKTEGHA